ncbi:hypothetical protein ABFX02_14G169500 [Erythranthe guttata]
MAAVAILELLRKNPNFGGQAFNSRGLFSQKLAGAATASAASLAVTVPFAFDDGATQYAYCDAGGGDYTSDYQTISRNLYRKDALTYSYSTKRYYIQLKSIFSVFYWENLALISLRSFLSRVDLIVVPFKKSVEQIIYEVTTVVTTTRVLERIVVHYVSRRAAWKLLKDVPMSAIRKSRRRLPLSTYIFNVGKTTFRGHFLGVLASWIVHVGVDIYEFFTHVYKRQFRVLAKWVFGATIGCGASLVFASIGGGVGATIINPAAGQFIGCVVGDFVGPVVVKFCFKKLRLNL